MHIGIKGGNIVVFGKTLAELEINASTRAIILDSIEETNEKIMPYYNTKNDGKYFKASEVPPVPSEIADEIAKEKRRELYSILSDPITNEISVMRDMIAQGDFESGSERSEIEEKIVTLHLQRKEIRSQIAASNPFAGY
jgi:hypothetical protein